MGLKRKKKNLAVRVKKKKKLNEANKKKRQRVDAELAGDTPQGDRAGAQK